jgi:DNA invertase Pin-like site-specific DNA recombinase
MKAYGYVRCSGLGQMDGDGPVRQREAIERFAQAHGIEIVEWFIESHTGADLENRPELKRMRTALVSNGVRIVIVEKLDRAARDVMIQESLIADFQRNKIELKSATPGEEDLCSNDPTRVLIRQILGAFFGYERKMIVSKLRTARERKRGNGERCEGQLRYGMKAGEAETLDKILYAKKVGLKPDVIAAMLNDRGITTRHGKTWRASTVARITKRVVV